VSLSDSSEESLTVSFFEKHPEWKRQERLLKDMKGNPWALFGGKKIASIILCSMFSAGLMRLWRRCSRFHRNVSENTA
jgi:hypothetical protein